MKNSSQLEYNIPYSKKMVEPERESVFISMGIEKHITVPPEIEYLYDEALQIFRILVAPKGFFKIIKAAKFKTILSENMENNGVIPLTSIIDKSEIIALFVATLGIKISAKIKKLIEEKDCPLSYMLDTIASRSAEKTAEIAEKYFCQKISLKDQKVLLYSPGYCGWKITAQQKIFNFLLPEKIGISLNKSSLMTPVKSISGVLVAGKKNIHNFKMVYPFCKTCQTHNCRERIKK